MTQPLSESDLPTSGLQALVAAALQAYADAVRSGLAPIPNYITLHTAGMPHDAFLALADRMDARIQVVEPADGQTFPPYARLDLPFGAGILPTSIDADIHATCGAIDERFRSNVETHNRECVTDEKGE